MRELSAAIPDGWTSMFEFMNVINSAQLERLPPHRKVVYVHLCWQHVDHY